VHVSHAHTPPLAWPSTHPPACASRCRLSFAPPLRTGACAGCPGSWRTVRRQCPGTKCPPAQRRRQRTGGSPWWPPPWRPAPSPPAPSKRTGWGAGTPQNAPPQGVPHNHGSGLHSTRRQTRGRAGPAPTSRAPPLPGVGTHFCCGQSLLGVEVGDDQLHDPHQKRNVVLLLNLELWRLWEHVPHHLHGALDPRVRPAHGTRTHTHTYIGLSLGWRGVCVCGPATRTSRTRYGRSRMRTVVGWVVGCMPQSAATCTTALGPQTGLAHTTALTAERSVSQGSHGSSWRRRLEGNTCLHVPANPKPSQKGRHVPHFTPMQARSKNADHHTEERSHAAGYPRAPACGVHRQRCVDHGVAGGKRATPRTGSCRRTTRPPSATQTAH
jgi:hypothetical protein